MMEHERVTRRKASAKETVSIGNFPTRMKRLLIPRRRPSAFSNFDLQDFFFVSFKSTRNSRREWRPRYWRAQWNGHYRGQLCTNSGPPSPQCGLQCIEVHGLHNLNDGRSYRTVSCRHIFSRMKVANLHQNWIAHKMQIIWVRWDLESFAKFTATFLYFDSHISLEFRLCILSYPPRRFSAEYRIPHTIWANHFLLKSFLPKITFKTSFRITENLTERTSPSNGSNSRTMRDLNHLMLFLPLFEF